MAHANRARLGLAAAHALRLATSPALPGPAAELGATNARPSRQEKLTEHAKGTSHIEVMHRWWPDVLGTLKKNKPDYLQLDLFGLHEISLIIENQKKFLGDVSYVTGKQVVDEWTAIKCPENFVGTTLPSKKSMRQLDPPPLPVYRTPTPRILEEDHSRLGINDMIHFMAPLGSHECIYDHANRRPLALAMTGGSARGTAR